jgi:hypothetical protein
MSMVPMAMLFTTVVMAANPELHYLLTVWKLVLTWKPVCNYAILPAFAPPSSFNTKPMAVSSILEGSMFGFAVRVALRTTERSSSGYASLKAPFLARVTGVRREERMTMSVGCFWRIDLRPRLERDIFGFELGNEEEGRGEGRRGDKGISCWGEAAHKKT